MSRDKIVAYLSPEITAAKARHRLTQVLYAPRRDLTFDDLFLGSNQLRLNFERIESDVSRFTDARRAGRWEAAVDAYTGPFLDGFFLMGNLDFERFSSLLKRLGLDF